MDDVVLGAVCAKASSSLLIRERYPLDINAVLSRAAVVSITPIFLFFVNLDIFLF